MVKHNSALDMTFAALSDPTRRAILSRLTKGDASVGMLAEPFDMSLPAISKHLRVLERAGLLIQSREGRVRRCRLRPAPLSAAAKWIDRNQKYWTRQLDALAAYLESEEVESNAPTGHAKPKEKENSS